MANDMRVRIKLEAEGEQIAESAELRPDLGALIEIGFGNAETTWRLDYREPDRLLLRVDGSIRLVAMQNVEIDAEGRFTRDLFENENTIRGSLEMAFDRRLNVEISGSSGPGGKRIGAGLTIAF
jgi:hypothetical protein